MVERKKKSGLKRKITWALLGILVLVIGVLYLYRQTNVQNVEESAVTPRPLDVVSFAALDWDPFREMQELQTRMNSMFDDSFQRAGVFGKPGTIAQNFANYSPSVDIRENAIGYVIVFDVPGITKDDLSIEVRDNTIIVSGERKEESDYTRKDVYMQERRFGSFSRSVPLPYNADTDKINAHCENGVLKINIPKKETGQTTNKKITVN